MQTAIQDNLGHFTFVKCIGSRRSDTTDTVPHKDCNCENDPIYTTLEANEGCIGLTEWYDPNIVLLTLNNPDSTLRGLETPSISYNSNLIILTGVRQVGGWTKTHRTMHANMENNSMSPEETKWMELEEGDKLLPRKIFWVFVSAIA